MQDVSEHTIAVLLARPAIVRGRLTWHARPPRIRAHVAVDNEPGELLEIEMHVSSRRPWHYSIVLLWSRRPIKRLDVRGSHTNQCDGSGRRWTAQTHKHPYSDQYELGQAYTPEDIPPTPNLRLAPGEHREVFEAFCKECNIDLDYEWEDPPHTARQITTIEGAT